MPRWRGKGSSPSLQDAAEMFLVAFQAACSAWMRVAASYQDESVPLSFARSEWGGADPAAETFLESQNTA